MASLMPVILKDPLLWSIPGQGSGSRPGPSFLPAPQGCLCTDRREGRLTWQGGRTGAIPELEWGCTPHSPGAEGAHSLDLREVWPREATVLRLPPRRSIH